MGSVSQNLNINISQQKMAQLIQQGHLCAADFKCLDAESKQTVWQLCLWCCEKRIHCEKACLSDCISHCGSKISITTA
ncbi:hypothetical protein CXF83_12870 [Shewanella sp. Choline-02u-19]|uniref:hypothetical protein n=1 Tax=unclassified Shewanella TaxID=196818 RepID=UPI000C34D808|nr:MULTISPECIES: hypothetical protein [unclassified Shewanella]PKG73698.1 hypothetical protein CXF86_15415 [Shewanella sp. GutCb]PKH56378.1 hypothetical protein CXF84_13850 [Shewanella sp. Bg11-22]PKI27528.1 hypothetical protein CXF83_12870 [Shewanella sp. Choline-02u-19]